MNKKHLKLLLDPYWILGALLRHVFSRFIKDDKTFIKWEYLSGIKRFPDLKNPKSFNEKLQWLKINDIHPEYARLVDKFEVKSYVEHLLGAEYVIPTLGVWNEFDEIDFDKLPNKFVLKTTHDSGYIALVTNKDERSLMHAATIIKKSLKHDLYMDHREYPYKNLKRRIIAEEFLVDESGTELKDYKFFCFNGVVRFFKVDFNRTIEHHANYYDLEMNLLPFGEKNYPPDETRTFKKPRNFSQMVKIAQTLSHNIPFLRVDLYNINGRIYFGEMTFFPASGNGTIHPKEWDYKIGKLLKLPIRINEV